MPCPASTIGIIGLTTMIAIIGTLAGIVVISHWRDRRGDGKQ